MTDFERVFLGTLTDQPYQFPYRCPTGNCTFTNVVSLAMCHTCKEISSPKHTCLLTVKEDRKNWNKSAPDSDSCALIEYHTPGNLNLTLINTAIRHQEVNKTNIDSTIMLSAAMSGESTIPPISKGNARFDPAATGEIPDMVPDFRTPTFVRFAMVQPLSFAKTESRNWATRGFDPTQLTITECQLDWCAKLYHSVHVVRKLPCSRDTTLISY